MKFNLTQKNFFFQSALMSTISFKIFRSALTWSHFKKLVHNAIFKALCNTMCMHMSENMPGASRVNMLVMVISSKIDCKEIYLKNVFTMRDYLKRFVTQWVCIRLIICQQSHVWFCWSSNLKAKLIAKPNMYKFFIVFEKKWEKNVIKKLMLEF